MQDPRALKAEVTGADLDAPGQFKVVLSSVGNPDRDQDPDRPLYGVRDRSAKVATLREASAKCRAYIDENGLGGGNVVDLETGKPEAYISYNGRVWKV